MIFFDKKNKFKIDSELTQNPKQERRLMSNFFSKLTGTADSFVSKGPVAVADQKPIVDQKMVITSPDSKTSITVYCTKDYDKFKFFTSNRIVTRNMSLETEILQCNKLKYHPIVVNEQMYVIDGQHRLEICKKHKLELYYVIDHLASEDDIRLVQSAKKWRQSDFIRYYKIKGNTNYAFMSDMIEKYGIHVTTFTHSFCDRGSNVPVAQLVNRGDVKLKRNFEDIEVILSKFHSVRDVCLKYLKEKKLNRDFERTLIGILMIEGCDVAEMIRKMDMSPDEIKLAYSFNKVENIREVLLSVYNKGKSKNQLLFK